MDHLEINHNIEAGTYSGQVPKLHGVNPVAVGPGHLTSASVLLHQGDPGRGEEQADGLGDSLDIHGQGTCSCEPGLHRQAAKHGILQVASLSGYDAPYHMLLLLGEGEGLPIL